MPWGRRVPDIFDEIRKRQTFSESREKDIQAFLCGFNPVYRNDAKAYGFLADGHQRRFDLFLDNANVAAQVSKRAESPISKSADL